MKPFLIFSFLFMLSTSIFSQDNEWINRVKFQPTEQCADTTPCYTKVIMEINPEKVPDASTIWLKIGSTYGDADIYSRRIQKPTVVTGQPQVTTGENGIIVVDLGNFIIEGDFFVDMNIE